MSIVSNFPDVFVCNATTDSMFFAQETLVTMYINSEGTEDLAPGEVTYNSGFGFMYFDPSNGEQLSTDWDCSEGSNLWEDNFTTFDFGEGGGGNGGEENYSPFVVDIGAVLGFGILIFIFTFYGFIYYFKRKNV